MEVENAKIGQVIGKSGSTVNTIRQETGATIDIQTQPGQQPRDRTTIVVKCVSFLYSLFVLPFVALGQIVSA